LDHAEYQRMFEREDRYWWFVGRRRLALGLLDRELGPARQGRKILDLGCGTGVVLQELQSSGAEATGLDFSSEALEFCQQRSLGNLVQGDAQALPFGDRTFDAILGLDVFEHIESDEKAFQEAHRVLQPEGVLILSVPTFKWLWGPHDVALHHFRRYTRAEMVRKLQDAGFEIVQASYAVFWLFGIVLLTRMVEKFRRGPAKAVLPRVPEWVNAWLIRLQTSEGRAIVNGTQWPVGSSVVVIARRKIE
jgi:SAM-dependent methyltransferase